MNPELVEELLADTKIEDIADTYVPVVEIVGVELFAKLSEYAKGDELYFPKVENIIVPARNRRIKKEYDGWNMKELAEKYGLTVKQIANILKDVPHPAQMSIFDVYGDV